MIKQFLQYFSAAFQTDDESGSKSSSFLALLIRTGTILLLYVLIDRSLMHIARLPQLSYERPFIFLESLRVQLQGARLLFLLPLGYLFFRYWKGLWEGWSSIDLGRTRRPIVVLAAAMLAWYYSTYDYNFYFDQGHYWDRVLLVVLVFLAWWRPLFVFPFLVVLLPLIGQFHYPLGGYSWVVPLLPIRILMLFGASWLLRALTGYWKTTDFGVLACCLLASHFWPSGLGKLRIGWIVQDHIYYLLPSTYANGWLGFMEPMQLSALTRTLSWLNWPMKGFTLLVECGWLFCLWRRSFFLALLTGSILLHLGIFFLSGIAFWMWIVLEAGLLVLFLKRGGHQAFLLFSRPYFVLSFALILGSAFWFRPTALVWYETRATYTYRFEAIGTSGERYALPPEFFEPYDHRFALSSFRFLSREPRLGITWGATSGRGIADALVQARSPEGILKVETEFGTDASQAKRPRARDGFLSRFVASRNRRGSQQGFFDPLAAPRLIWTFPRENAYEGQEPIVGVTVYEVTSMYDDRHYSEIRNQVIHEMRLDQ